MESPIIEALKAIYRHPVTRVVSDASLGASVGGFAGSLMYKDEYEKLKEIMASKENQVKAEEYVAKYAPGLDLISTRGDVEKNKNFNFLEKFILKHSIPKGNKAWDNAFYLPAGDHSAVLVPKKVNPYIIGHEMGHHRDLEGKEPGFFSTGLTGLLTGKTVDMERKAWEKSPVEIDEKGKEVKDLALGSYENLQKYVRLGFGLGLAAGATKAFGPKVLELIRGNVR
jgi:hypothetical protein